MSLILVLFLRVAPSFAQTVMDDTYETVLPLADLQRMRDAKVNGEYWLTKEGIYILYKGNGQFKISCQPRFDLEAPEVDPAKRPQECWISITPNHLKKFLQLTEKAKKSNQEEKMEGMSTSCTAAACTIVSKR